MRKYNFFEAMESYEDGCKITSEVTGDSYIKIKDVDYYKTKRFGDNWNVNHEVDTNLSLAEIRGKWNIE